MEGVEDLINGCLDFMAHFQEIHVITFVGCDIGIS
jgi:hypothetical protein